MQNRASPENEKNTPATIGIPYESIFVEEGLSSDGNEGSSTGQSSQQMRKVTGFRWWLMLVSVLSSVFLYSLDNTIVADIQPDIVDTLGEIEKLPWLAIGFLVACVATNSIWYVLWPRNPSSVDRSIRARFFNPLIYSLIVLGAKYTRNLTPSGHICYASFFSKLDRPSVVQPLQ